MVAATVSGMGTLSTKKKSDNAEGAADGGEDGATGSPWLSSNGDNEPDSVEAVDTLFLKELKAKGQVRGLGKTR